MFVFGFTVYGLGIRVRLISEIMILKIIGIECLCLGLGFRVYGLGFRV